MSILALFEWLDASALGVAVKQSTWAVPALGTLHLIALAAMFGGMLAVNLRLLGLAFAEQSPGQVARQSAPLSWGGTFATAVSGVLLLSGEAAKCYFNPAFRWKIGLLVPAIAISLLLHRESGRERQQTPVWMRAGAVCALVLWSAVAVAGRAIGFT